ncbi:MAG: trypsin-like peptidase domain-containing protein [Candidatus Moranbacteria bacterium]|nr:trypsin-like peptidase domain-containing protein [Candidatus Moranbacteria bacterium]
MGYFFSRHLSAFLLSLIVFVFFPGNALVQAEIFSEEALARLAQPAIVRVVQHVTGTAKIPKIKVDIRRGLVAVVPGSFMTVKVDEYLMGSGFIVHPDGYIATNAHVVSRKTIEQMLVSEGAISAFYQSALLLSDDEMEEFLRAEEEENGFAPKVLNFIIAQSEFDLTRTVTVLRPTTIQKNVKDSLADGFPATIVSVHDDFLEDEKDVAIVHIEEKRLPALSLGEETEKSVGEKVFIFGFPATAERGQQSSLEATFTQGVIGAIKQSIKKDFHIFQTDAKVSEGSSGGPLLDEKGSVFGIVSFQTAELERSQGDNFAFALPIGLVRTMLFDAHISPVSGAYEQYFKKGLDAFTKKHCTDAKKYFHSAIDESNPYFVSERFVAEYIKQCAEWEEKGLTLDTMFDTLKNDYRSYKPFFYVMSVALVLFCVMGGALAVLFREVRREEGEISALEIRVQNDEERLWIYQQEKTLSREKVQKTVGQSEKISRKKII